MKITDNRTENFKKYDDVNEGEVFILEEIVYMKTDYSDDYDLCVCLSDGHTDAFNKNTMVTVVNAEMTIE